MGLWGRSTLGVSLLTLILLASSIAQAKMVSGVIEKNVDGDTVWFLHGKEVAPKDRLKIRMMAVDTPETHLPTLDSGIVGQGYWGDKATEELESMIPVGTRVVIQDFGLDKYKRTLGRILLDGEDVNLAMVRSGWGLPYLICEGKRCDHNYLEEENAEEYLKACDYAQTNGLGIFNPRKPLKEMPFEFRLRMQKRVPDKWVGNYYTKELVRPEDYRKVPVCSRIFFPVMKDAKMLGFEFRE